MRVHYRFAGGAYRPGALLRGIKRRSSLLRGFHNSWNLGVLLERLNGIQEVGGSTPPGSTKFLNNLAKSNFAISHSIATDYATPISPRENPSQVGSALQAVAGLQFPTWSRGRDCRSNSPGNPAVSRMHRRGAQAHEIFHISKIGPRRLRSDQPRHEPEAPGCQIHFRGPVPGWCRHSAEQAASERLAGAACGGHPEIIGRVAEPERSIQR